MKFIYNATLRDRLPDYFLLFILLSIFAFHCFIIMCNTLFARETCEWKELRSSHKTLEVLMRFIYVILLYSRNIAGSKGDQCLHVFATQQNGTSDIYACRRQLRLSPSQTSNISSLTPARITPYVI